ncbi:MAG: hypothetical protein ABI402_19660 [Ferruginibacter sp.]
MKKLFSKNGLYLACTFLIIIFSSCKKDSPGESANPGSQYYVSFKIDGTTIKYTSTAEGNINVIDANGHYDCSIAGLKDENVSDKATMTILMVTSDPMTTSNTYINYGTSSGSNIRTLLGSIARHDDAGTFFASWGDEFASAGVVSDTRINFTEITDAYIKGNFSGTIYEQIDGNSEKHLITEGVFKVKRVQ